MFDDISFLVQETFNEAAKFADRASLLEVPEDTSGVLFHVEKQSSTFVVRIKVCHDLARDFNKAYKNIDEFLARVEKEHGQIVFFAMSVPDYELMSYNMQELKRYINELKQVVVYYRKVTTNKPETGE